MHGPFSRPGPVHGSFSYVSLVIPQFSSTRRGHCHFYKQENGDKLHSWRGEGLERRLSPRHCLARGAHRGPGARVTLPTPSSSVHSGCHSSRVGGSPRPLVEVLKEKGGAGTPEPQLQHLPQWIWGPGLERELSLGPGGTGRTGEAHSHRKFWCGGCRPPQWFSPDALVSGLGKDGYPALALTRCFCFLTELCHAQTSRGLHEDL